MVLVPPSGLFEGWPSFSTGAREIRLAVHSASFKSSWVPPLAHSTSFSSPPRSESLEPMSFFCVSYMLCINRERQLHGHLLLRLSVGFGSGSS